MSNFNIDNKKYKHIWKLLYSMYHNNKVHIFSVGFITIASKGEINV